jgi:hypothetical protein
MQYRIGDRDPVTGLYDVIHPDGSATRNGIKIFNSAHEFGDVVLATQRSDGMMILDGVKATLTEVVTNSFGLGGFGEKPVGYLAGQVFNNEEEVILPTVSIDFAPGSPTELEPGAGDFVVRIKIDRPQRKDLRVKCELAGTAAIGDYTVSGLDGDLIAIVPAGADYFDITIAPIGNFLGVNETVVITAIQASGYKVGLSKEVTATLLPAALPYISYTFAPGSATTLNINSGSSFVIRVFVDRPQLVDLDVGCNLVELYELGYESFLSTSFSTDLSASPRFIFPAGANFVDLILTPHNTHVWDSPFNLTRGVAFSIYGDTSVPPQYSALSYGYIKMNVFVPAVGTVFP